MRACKPATRSAEGPMSTPRRLAPRSMGTPMIRIFCGILIPKRRLRIYPVKHARERNHFANVLCPANPGYGAFQTQTEAGMGDAAVAAKIEIPLKGFFRQVVLAQALDEQIVIVDALAAADDLAVAFGRKHVKGEGEVGPFRVGLHVEGFDGRGIAMDYHGATELVGDDAFFFAPHSLPNLPRIT